MRKVVNNFGEEMRKVVPLKTIQHNFNEAFQAKFLFLLMSFFFETNEKLLNCEEMNIFLKKLFLNGELSRKNILLSNSLKESISLWLDFWRKTQNYLKN